MDIKNFNLMKPLKRLDNIPEDVRQEYKLSEKVTTEWWVYVKVYKGMYGLPQVGKLAQELLVKRLATHGYTQSKLTPAFGNTKKMNPVLFSGGQF